MVEAGALTHLRAPIQWAMGLAWILTHPDFHGANYECDDCTKIKPNRDK